MSHDRASWLVLLFMLLAVSIPTVCVLWFTNKTVNIQRESARQKLIEAYRSQMLLARDRLDEYWGKRRTELDLLTTSGAAVMIFARAVNEGIADAVICLNSDGSVSYPSLLMQTAADPVEQDQNWIDARAHENSGDEVGAAVAFGRFADAQGDSSLKARALQAQVRNLVRAGHKEAAIRVIRERFINSAVATGTDLQGRLISADENLLALQLMKPLAPDYINTAKRLRDILADYSLALTSSQRVFLMSELSALRLGPEFEITRAYKAERLAADFLAANRVRRDDRALIASAVPGVWSMASPSGRLVALFRSETLVAAMSRFLNEQNTSPVASFNVLAPGVDSQADETILAGPMLTGWQIGLSLTEDPSFQDVVRRQTISSVWAAILAIAMLAITGMLGGRMIRKQMRLARLKTDLVAAISHELKTPLASIQLLTDGLLEEDKFEPVKTREYLNLVTHENRRLSRLIENFLAFSRIDRNRHKFEFAETNVADIVHAAVDAVGQRLSAPKCRLEVEMSPGLPIIRADQGALVTVLLNLIDNAYKFTPSEKQISLRVSSEGSCVSFAVSDNGIGIALREQKRIFRSFYQVDCRLSRQSGGCGLGLSIVEFIVKAHSGSVQVKSQLGDGTTFLVSLPSTASPDRTVA